MDGMTTLCSSIKTRKNLYVYQSLVREMWWWIEDETGWTHKN
jgi:hypothetical protein